MENNYFGFAVKLSAAFKQQTTVIGTDRLCLSNGTAESHTETHVGRWRGRHTERASRWERRP